MTKRVLITGGAGYLGSILCEHLLDAGYHVTVIDSLVFQQRSLYHLCARPGFHFVRGDARDSELVARELAHADVVIPLAAVVGAPACDRDPWLAQAVNVEAIKTLQRHRSDQQLVVVPITNSGYGTKSGETLCDENTPLEPISLYGRTKVEAERFLLDTPNVISLRLATVFGMSPRMRIDLLVNHFVYAAVTDGYIVLFEEHFKRNYVHIRDVGDAFVHAIENSESMVGRPFNLGLDDANLSKKELSEVIKRHVPSFVVMTSQLRADPDKRNYIVSNARLREAGFAARRSLDDGVRELLEGYAMLPRGELGNV
jgi:nucleoside-diphosphate-sugar epimerase